MSASPRSTVRRIATHEYQFQSRWTFVVCDVRGAVSGERHGPVVDAVAELWSPQSPPCADIALVISWQ